MIWALDTTNNNNALFVVDLGTKIGKEYIIVIDDVMRMLLVQFTIQFMSFLSDPTHVALFSAEYVLLSFYITLGVCMYWLVFRNIVRFV